MFEKDVLIRGNLSRKSSLKTNQGFTLIEVVVVMAIIAVLAALVVGAITVARKTAIETQARTDARTIQTGLEAYFAQHRAYPDYFNPHTGGNWIGFGEIADASHLNLKLSSSINCYNPGTNDWHGAGIVYVHPNQVIAGRLDPDLPNGSQLINYAIEPVNADCSNWLKKDYIDGP